MSEEIERWEMERAPTGSKLQTPDKPRNWLGTFDMLQRANEELLRQPGRRRCPSWPASRRRCIILRGALRTWRRVGT